MRSLLVASLAVACLACLGTTANAQNRIGPNQGPVYGPGYRGNISPYLNLFRGQNTGIDYYLGTRAEQQRRQDAGQFRDEIDDLGRDPLGGVDDPTRRPQPVQSGTAATFGSTLGYYNNRQNYVAPTVGRLGAGVGAPAPARRR